MRKLILLMLPLLVSLSLQAQTGQGFNYKALISQNGNALVNQQVNLRFTILDGANTVLFQETHSATTDASGILNVNVGEGNVISGDFTSIDWAQNLYLKVEIDVGNGYQDFGTTALKYVPYAKYADIAGNTFSGSFNDLTDVPPGLSDGDDDTHLTEAQVDAYVANNGYLTSEVDGDVTNELQTLSLSGTQLTISNGNTVNFSGWDTDASDDFSGYYSDLIGRPIAFYKQNNGDMPTTIGDNIYRYGNMSLGFDAQDTATGLLSLMTQDVNLGGKFNAITISNFISMGGGTAVRNIYHSSATGSLIGYSNENTTNGSGSWIGYKNYFAGNGNNQRIGYYNEISGNGNGQIYGTYNIINNRGNGIHVANYNFTKAQYYNYGIYNQLVGGQNQYAIYNYINTSTAPSSKFIAGMYDSIVVDTVNEVYGSYDYLKSNGYASLCGSYIKLVNNGYAMSTGQQIEIYGSSTDAYGLDITVVNDISYPAVGISAYVSGNGLDDKYGIKVTIPILSKGLHFGVYSEALGNDNYAGYFVGNVKITHKLKGVQSGDADMKAYVYGLVYYNGNVDNNRSSDGFSVNKTGTGTYEITLSGNIGQGYIVSVTSEMASSGTPVIATTDYTSTSGKFIVRMFKLDGNLIDNSFHFVVFKK